MNEAMTYRQTGVNYDAMDPYKRRACAAAAHLDHFSERLGFKVVTWSRGESVFLFEMETGYIGFLVEGLGTKIKVADAMYDVARKMHRLTGSMYYRHVAQCNFAMASNDAATLGLFGLGYGQYLGVGDSGWFSQEERSAGIIEGTAHSCQVARTVWAGGETPTLRDVIFPDTADLAGAFLGFVPKDKVYNPDSLQARDAIVIIGSSGIHANGLTLARAIAEKLAWGHERWWKRGLRATAATLGLTRFARWLKPSEEAMGKAYLTKLSSDQSYGAALLEPTLIYAPLIEALAEAGVTVRYGVNVTGHGWRKFMRAMKKFAYIIERLPPEPAIFRFLQKHGPVDDREAYGNLNMGAGFVLYVPPHEVSRVLEIAQKLGFAAVHAGRLEESDKKRVEIRPLGIVFEEDELQVR